MNNIRKVLVRVETNWCGEWREFTAIICDECLGDFETYCEIQAYDNFLSFDGPEALMFDEFGDPENEDEGWTEEQYAEGETKECEYYSFNYHDFNEESDGEWDWYDLEWDCTKE